MNSAEQVLRERLCEVGRRSWQRGFCNGNEGNMSVRLDRARVLVTPTGLSKGFMTPAQMCVVDLAGRQIGADATPLRPTSELALHLAIYRRRADIRAVVHGHPPHATAFACSQALLPERLHPEGHAVLGKVPKVPYVQPGDPKLGEAVAAALEEKTSCVLLANHGAVCFHQDLLAAYYLLEMLEGYCRLAALVRALGPAAELTAQQAAALPRYNFE